MKRDDFEQLIERLELYARSRPSRYAFHVIALAALGYGYLFFSLLAVLVVAAGLVGIIVLEPNILTIKLAGGGLVVTLAVAVALCKALWVRMPKPEGREVTRAEAPALFALLDELRAKLAAPPFHHVVVTRDYNAGVQQVPRLGILGWQRNYLLLGLPLLGGLTPEEFRAVMAHEYAHLSGNHNRFTAWIYRVRQSWTRFFQEIGRHQHRGPVQAVFLKFINWYAPYFDAYSFVLARTHEYVADRCAVEFAGGEAAGGALVRIAVQGQLVSERFWPGLLQRATTQPEAAGEVFTELADALRQGPTEAEARKWFSHAITVKTNNVDTHPCLKERLAAIGMDTAAAPENATLSVPANGHAGAYFLGAEFARVQARMDEEWRKEVAPQWKERYEASQKNEKRLSEMEGKAPDRPPTTAEAWERVKILVDLKDDQTAEPLLQTILAQEPNHPGANFLMGRSLLQRDDATGVELLERAIKIDLEVHQAGTELLYGFYQRVGRHDDAKALLRRYDEHSELVRKAQMERANIAATDIFIPHGLAAAAVAEIAQKLQAYPEIAQAYLARKLLQHFPERPRFLLIVKPRRKWYKFQSTGDDGKLVAKMANELVMPGPTTIMVPDGIFAKIGKKVIAVPDSKIYEAAKK